MICPYCNTRNAPNSAICSHCGAILRDKVAKRPVERNLRSLVLRILTYPLVGLCAGAFFYFLSKRLSDGNHKIELISGIAGVVMGVLIVLFVSAGRVIIFTVIYRGRLNQATTQIKTRRAKAMKRIEDAIKKEPSGALRAQLGIAYLVDNETDQGLQQFEQALRLGMRSAEFNNAYGIALARKGHLDAALDKFARAADNDPKNPAPRVNLANALLQTRDKTRAAEAAGLIRAAIRSDDSNPRLLAHLGRALIEVNDSKGAIEVLQKASEGGGKELQADAANLQGLAYLSTDELKEANDSFRSAVSSDPANAHAIANQGVVLLKQNKTLNAVDKLKAALDVDPAAAKARCDYGCALIQDNSLNEGIREIREATVQDPLLIEAHFNLGKVYADNAIYTAADRYFTTCLKVNPRFWQAAAGMGLIHYYVGPVERAVSWYKEAEKIAPDQPIVLGGLALCRALQNDFDEAELLFRKAIEIDPRNSASLANYGWLLLNKQNVEMAAQFIERAVAHNKTMPSALNNMALCNIEMGANDLALKNFKKALEINPDMVQVHYNIGHIYMLEKDMTNAMREWEMAAKLETNLADVHTNLGVAHYQMKKFEMAVNDFKRAIQIRQDRMDEFANLGLALSRCGRHGEAIEHFDKAVAIAPNNPMLHSNRGLACYFAKRVEDAMVEWRIVAQLNAEYARTRHTKQQSEFDEASMEFIPLYVTERAINAVPASSEFLYATLPGYIVDSWEFFISDADMRDIPALKAEQGRAQRLLRSLKL